MVVNSVPDWCWCLITISQNHSLSICLAVLGSFSQRVWIVSQGVDSKFQIRNLSFLLRLDQY